MTLRINTIQTEVARAFGIRQTDMISQQRYRNVARPRQVAIYLARQMTARSMPQIGHEFGNRDHTTIHYAIKRVEQLIRDEPGFNAKVEAVRATLIGLGVGDA